MSRALGDVPPLYRETWAVYETLRRLGFSDDSIEYQAAPIAGEDGAVLCEGTPFLLVVLTAQGRTFRVVMGPLDRTAEEATAVLQRFVERLLASPEAVGQRVWKESRMASAEAFVQLFTRLMAAGFSAPALVN